MTKLSIPAGEYSSTVFYPPNPYKPLGRPYSEWIRNWYEWIQKIPQESNPVIDTIGTDCGKNQTGPVWFLVGTRGGTADRSCTIVANKDVFVPIINELSSTTQYRKKGQELITYCENIINQVVEKELSFDDQKLQGLELNKYRSRSDLFEMVLPVNNLCGLPQGHTEVICDGYWVMIKKEALTIGNHLLKFKARQSDGFALDVKYDIQIK